MAGVKGAVSSGSLTSMASFASDAIPREYHRKILKKIAQLTKVEIVKFIVIIMLVFQHLNTAIIISTIIL